MPSRRARVALGRRRRHAPRVCAALVGELHAVRICGTPTLPALGLLPSEKGNLTDDEKQPYTTIHDDTRRYTTIQADTWESCIGPAIHYPPFSPATTLIRLRRTLRRVRLTVSGRITSGAKENKGRSARVFMWRVVMVFL